MRTRPRASTPSTAHSVTVITCNRGTDNLPRIDIKSCWYPSEVHKDLGCKILEFVASFAWRRCGWEY